MISQIFLLAGLMFIGGNSQRVIPVDQYLDQYVTAAVCNHDSCASTFTALNDTSETEFSLKGQFGVLSCVYELGSGIDDGTACNPKQSTCQISSYCQGQYPNQPYFLMSPQCYVPGKGYYCGPSTFQCTTDVAPSCYSEATCGGIVV